MLVSCLLFTLCIGCCLFLGLPCMCLVPRALFSLCMCYYYAMCVYVFVVVSRVFVDLSVTSCVLCYVFVLVSSLMCYVLASACFFCCLYACCGYFVLLGVIYLCVGYYWCHV